MKRENYGTNYFFDPTHERAEALLKAINGSDLRSKEYFAREDLLFLLPLSNVATFTRCNYVYQAVRYLIEKGQLKKLDGRNLCLRSQENSNIDRLTIVYKKLLDYFINADDTGKDFNQLRAVAYDRTISEWSNLRLLLKALQKLIKDKQLYLQEQKYYLIPVPASAEIVQFKECK